MGRASDPRERREEQRTQVSLRAAERLLQRLATRVEQLSRYTEDPLDDITFITTITFRVGSSWNEGVLAIIKAERGDQAIVAFHSEASLDECIVGLTGRLINGSLKWREDTPYEDNK